VSDPAREETQLFPRGWSELSRERRRAAQTAPPKIEDLFQDLQAAGLQATKTK